MYSPLEIAIKKNLRLELAQKKFLELFHWPVPCLLLVMFAVSAVVCSLYLVLHWVVTCQSTYPASHPLQLVDAEITLEFKPNPGRKYWDFLKTFWTCCSVSRAFLFSCLLLNGSVKWIISELELSWLQVFVASRVDVPGAWQMPQVLCFGFLWSVFAPLRKQGIRKTRNLFL
jgi:hypothetical protein